ncbi:hypothetical protein PAXRUDRAFT_26161 [Paxillus rubicundulus Ve08.2h10]|uniref:Uncharacterized protein n=1 Tax=Paxillus rubicundulus Ve08.2h10 TaxID=930991 RepID=A0A0D0E148_9AGAM|nr:hypothetical protein PAXRUDRAFT_26161 [Paxillus rubicundulus Ve08.2h10]
MFNDINADQLLAIQTNLVGLGRSGVRVPPPRPCGHCSYYWGFVADSVHLRSIIARTGDTTHLVKLPDGHYPNLPAVLIRHRAQTLRGRCQGTFLLPLLLELCWRNTAFSEWKRLKACSASNRRRLEPFGGIAGGAADTAVMRGPSGVLQDLHSRSTTLDG